MIKKIAFVSGTRADFGLMRSILRSVDKNFSLQLYATGMHLMPEFGLTVNEVEEEFPSTIRIPAIIHSDKRESLVSFSAELLASLSSFFTSSRPDLVMMIGDRVEMLAVATACLYLGIPTAHFHGGDTTGTVDEVARHAITKLSSLHFPATKQSADRIIRMGEDPLRVFVVGAPGLEAIDSSLPNKTTIYSFLGFPISLPYIVVLQHPVSEEIELSKKHIQHTIDAVSSFLLPVVYIYPNADSGGRIIISAIDAQKGSPNVRIFANIEHNLFLGLLRYSSVLVGNSSAGIIESGSFKLPVVDIGTRQQGRERGKNVLHSGYEKNDIIKKINYALFDNQFKQSVSSLVNIWGDGKTSKKVLKILTSIGDPTELLKKQITY